MTTYVLTRDGEEVMRGTELETWRYIHWNHCYSVSYACQYAGYKITPEVEHEQATQQDHDPTRTR